MGSWNATCGITQLPIQEGDAVVAMFVMTSRAAGMSTGSSLTDAFADVRPVAIPFGGYYTDCGRITPATPPKALLLALQKVDRIDMEFTSLDDFLESVLEGERTCRDHGRSKDAPMSLCMAHAPAWNKILAEQLPQEKTATVFKKVSDGLAHVAELREIMAQAKDTEDPLAKARLMASLHHLGTNPPLPDAFSQILQFETAAVTAPRKALLKLIEENPFDVLSTAEDLVRGMASISRLHDAFNALRKTLTPQNAAGDDATNFQAHRAFSSYVGELATQMGHLEPAPAAKVAHTAKPAP